MKKKLKTIKHNDTYLNIGSKGHFYLSLTPSNLAEYEYGYINTSISLSANTEAEYEGLMIMLTDDFYQFDAISKFDDKIKINYSINNSDIHITEKVNLIEDTNVVTQTTCVKNTGNGEITLSRLAAANVTGIGLGGQRSWTVDNERFNVYYCCNHWQGEGQWFKKSLRDLGIYPASRHPWEACSYRFQSVGSWSTGSYYPLLIIEDTELNECWFFEREGTENWFIEIRAFEGMISPFLTVCIGGADEEIGFLHTLKAGESYETSNAVYGVVKGDFEQAIIALTAYKRKASITKTDIQVTFNNFMNCNWANPTEDELIALIDKASELGCDCFCIDDGWSVPGEWMPIESKFPKYGFAGIISYIIKKGMRAGVWTEFERAHLETVKTLGDENALIKRNERLVSHHRPKLNMRCQSVRKWLAERVDYLYNLGVRFIKNDHNNHERLGSNIGDECPAVGLKRNSMALCDFIDELREKYPDMIFENCGSGAMRADFGTLKHFHLQSTSDQEDYKLYPSIMIGSMAFIPPEKAGCWSYPNPLEYEYLDDKKLPKEVRIEQQKDGRQTIFNMVTSMLGYMYLSGRIEGLDELNTLLVIEGIKVYKSYSRDIKNRYPAFVLPLKPMWDKSYNAFGLNGKDDMILGAWALEEKKFSIDLKTYGYQTAEIIYPSIDAQTFVFYNGILEVEFNEKYSACLLKLTK